MSAIQTWALNSFDLSVPASLRSSSTRRSTWAVWDLISPTIGLGGDAGEIRDFAVRLADSRLTAIFVCYLPNLVACDRHDVPFLGIECPAFFGPLTRMEA